MSLRSLVPARVRRSAAELADVADLRSAVVASLSAAPINEIALRRNVWTLVGTERDAGAANACATGAIVPSHPVVRRGVFPLPRRRHPPARNRYGSKSPAAGIQPMTPEARRAIHTK